MSEKCLPSKEGETRSPLEKWRRVAKRVCFQKKWTKQCITKTLNVSDGEGMEEKDVQQIPFDANSKINFNFQTVTQLRQ